MKKKNKLYDYLEQTGVLSHGSSEQIAEAKETYWKLVRKAWRKKQREECKSYTVFFSASEQMKIKKAVAVHHTTTTKFIKEASLSKAMNTSGVDARILGQIRQIFFETYNRHKRGNSEHILIEITRLETSVLQLLR